MLVRIPSPLRSYTEQKSQVEARGKSMEAILLDLDRQHPGIRFRMIDEQGRIREHIRIFVNSKAVTELTSNVSPTDTVHIICALSGG
jgi:molybdopterin converting factor small subunit